MGPPLQQESICAGVHAGQIWHAALPHKHGLHSVPSGGSRKARPQWYIVYDAHLHAAGPMQDEASQSDVPS